MSIPIVRNRDYGVIEFALKYNLSLRVLNASYKLTVATSVFPDIQLKSQVHTNMDNLKNWNPHDISSLMVAVPCGKELRIEEVFKQLDLFLAINVLGLIFSSFFSCKLSALLMKHSDQPQVKNFEDLRDSGLPVIVGPTMDAFPKSEAGSDFVKNNLIALKYVSQWDRVEMLLKANTSNAYLLYSEDWNILDNFWKFYGHKMLCKSEHLTIIQALPITYIYPQ
ncbi:GM26402 [Drosophila sechellia]|uniref:GM26402 n=1 Tax=Drosophila sechellia TaxID=7238 RepID=B4HE42_DROSE|nr:GM26402 [Drosophila sechellia]